MKYQNYLFVPRIFPVQYGCSFRNSFKHFFELPLDFGTARRLTAMKCLYESLHDETIGCIFVRPGWGCWMRRIQRQQRRELQGIMSRYSGTATLEKQSKKWRRSNRRMGFIECSDKTLTSAGVAPLHELPSSCETPNEFVVLNFWKLQSHCLVRAKDTDTKDTTPAEGKLSEGKNSTIVTLDNREEGARKWYAKI